MRSFLGTKDNFWGVKEVKGVKDISFCGSGFSSLFHLSTILLLLVSLFISSHADAKNSDLYAERDSLMALLGKIPSDSARLDKTYELVREYTERVWCEDLIEYGRNLAVKQKNHEGEVIMLGLRARWAMAFNDWKRVEKYMMEQRHKALEYKCYDAYLNQIDGVIYRSSASNHYEFSWQMMKIMENDVIALGAKGYKEYGEYVYIAKANYFFNKGEVDKCRDVVLEALNSDVKMSVYSRKELYHVLADAMLSDKHYERCVVYADSVLMYYDKHLPRLKNTGDGRANMTAAVLMKVESYWNMKQYADMKKCLLEAAEYAGDMEPAASAIDYMWAMYHLGIKDYETSLRVFDDAIGRLRDQLPDMDLLNLEKDRVLVMRAMGDDDGALKFYLPKIAAYDSYCNSMLEEQNAYLEGLKDVLDQKEKAEEIRAWKGRLIGILGVVVFILFLFVVIYLIKVRKKIKHNYSVAEHNLMLANAADKDKERFLRNITQLINEPLQQVVEVAGVLAEETSLSAERKEQLLAQNKVKVALVLKLVNNVLDLSRLEAGMMKYNSTEMDVAMAVLEYVVGFNARNADNPIELDFVADSYNMQMDPSRFSAMMESLFPVTEDKTSTPKEKREVRVEVLDGKLVITVKGSPYAYEDQLDETERMVNSINRYILRDFNSQYEITENHDIVMTLS
ncbi:MAG: HAMP domain-containing histidine kinase [Bacteroidaceae bacterium]|nr:HAMP domain-containing histidine kinase [Bacteroidaceae bacterium]